MQAKLIDIERRIFILERLAGREISAPDLHRMAQRDFPRKQVTERRMYEALYKLHRFSNVKRVPAPEGEKDVICYTTTDAGKRKLIYLNKKAKEMRQNGPD